MITFKELVKNTPINDIPLTHQHNLEELLLRINKFRLVYGKPMSVTSGYRTMQDHIRIYSKINAERVKNNLPEIKVPTKSSHLTGCAVDIYSPTSELMDFCKSNIELLEQIGLWIEDDISQPRVHFQINPPLSGNRFFKP